MMRLSDYLGSAHDTTKSHPHLFAEASLIRDRHWGRTATYSRKVFVPLTTLCRDECGYCAFVKRPGSPAARYMTPEEVLQVAHAGAAVGCKEVLFSLGEKPELRYEAARSALSRLGYRRTVDYLHDMCALVLGETGLLPHVNAGTLSDHELLQLRPVAASMGMMLETVSRRLNQRDGAHYACPDKVPLQRLRCLERAGQHAIPFTTGLLIGIGETWEERVDALVAINELHRQFGHIQEVIIQNFRAKPGTAMADHPEPGLFEMLNTIAAARCILDPSISVQAPPNLEEAYPRYLEAGLNDWGGISPLTIDYINPERAWPNIASLEGFCEEAGFALRERLTIYPNYLAAPDRWIDPALQQQVLKHASPEGLAGAPAMRTPVLQEDVR